VHARYDENKLESYSFIAGVVQFHSLFSVILVSLVFSTFIGVLWNVIATTEANSDKFHIDIPNVV
jgi:hypothetical protein